MVESATGPSRQSRRERGGTWSALLSFPASLDFVQLLSLMFLLGVGLVFIRSTGEQVGTEASLGFFAKQRCSGSLPHRSTIVKFSTGC